MAEWLIEEGIGEHRAVLIEGGEAVASRMEWPGRLAAGLIADATLISRAGGSKRGTARFPGGEEALVDGLPREAAEGGAIRLEVTRSAISEAGRGKLARARPTTKPPCPAPSLCEQLGKSDVPARIVRRFPAGIWEDIFADAWHSEVLFAGGSLTISPTPAMTLIDVDGTLQTASLAVVAARTVASVIRRFDLCGNVGIDFPTLAEKADRRAVDCELADALVAWPHERTAMNGFGFVQIVSRQDRPSMIARLATDRAGAAARQLLRRAEHVDQAGSILLTAHSAVKAAVSSAMLGDLERLTGRQLSWITDDTLAYYGAYAQAISV